MNNREGVISPLLLIIISLVVVSILGSASYYFWQSSQTKDIEPLAEFPERNENVEEEKKESVEEPVEEPDYKDLNILASLVPCYINGPSPSLFYFPEGKLRDFFTDASTKDKVAEMDCGKYMSPEAEEYVELILTTDSDQDGLNLYLEQVYNTNDYSPDTDGDSYDDLTEILNDYDPNGIEEDDSTLFDYYDEDPGIVEDEGGISGDSGDSVIDEGGDQGDEGDNQGGDEENDGDSSGDSGGSVIDEGSDESVDEGGNEGDEEDEDVDEVYESPEECLELDGDEEDACINSFAVESGDLSICDLSSNFNNCIASDWTIFVNMSSIDQCFEYENLLNLSNFDECMRVRALLDNNASYCLNMKDATPSECIFEAAESNNDVNHCAYLYFGADPENPDPAFSDHISCINQLYTTEPEVEQSALQGCQSIPIEELGQEYLLLEVICYNSLARNYDDESYCDMASMVTGVYLDQLYTDCIEQMNN